MSTAGTLDINIALEVVKEMGKNMIAYPNHPCDKWL